MTPRAIASDLDGTLLDDTGSLTPYTSGVLRAAKRRGVAIVAATSRPPRALSQWEQLGSCLDAAFCCTGAIVYTPSNRTIEYTQILDVSLAFATAAIIKATMPGITVAVETGIGLVAQTGYLTDITEDRVVVDSLEAVFDASSHIVKLLIYDPVGADALLDIARTARLPGVEVSHSGRSGPLEISAAGVTKAAALAAWCSSSGIDGTQVVAFGDMPNDVPMLTWAGTSYAVANAHPEVVTAADFTCGSNNEDGVAATLVELLALPEHELQR